MKERELTCIICPRGCNLHVTFDQEGNVARVTGNSCPRGVTYAITECTAPMRTVTTTVRCADGAVVPVKTGKPVPKKMIFSVMAEIKRTVAPNEVNVGDTVIRDVAGTDTDVVVTGKKLK